MQYSAMLSYGSLIVIVSQLLIILQSLLARAAFIKLSSWIRFETKSGYMYMMVISVFLIFFFQYGVLYVLGPLAVTNDFLSAINVGIYHDFS